MIITGHKGFIGKHVSEQLQGEGIDIKDGKDILTCSLPYADMVIHLAAQSRVIPSIEDPIHDAMVNIMGTIRLAQKYHDKRFIFTSSGGCIQETIESPYGLSKFCAEEYIKMICSDYVILRLPNVYGHPDSGSVVDKFVFQQEKLTIYGDGTATRSYVHVSDIVDAIKQARTWKKGTYYLGSGRYHSVLDLAKATGKEVTHEAPRKGELQETPLENNTPWNPTIDVIDYIKNKIWN